jgi:hypothetical protein
VNIECDVVIFIATQGTNESPPEASRTLAKMSNFLRDGFNRPNKACPF